MRIPLILLTLFGLSGCDLMTPKIVSLCEEVLKERLRSPSTYNRIEFTDAGSQTLSRDEYLMLMRDASVSASEVQANIRSFDDAGAKTKIFRYFISYDASNAYGVPLRGTADCEYLSHQGDENEASRYSIKVNGKTGTEWLVENIQKTLSP